MISTLLASISYQPIQRIGPVSPHGVGTAVGFLAGAMLMARRAEPRGIPRQETYNAVTWGALGAIIGARGFYVLAHFDQFRSVWDVLAVWQGGLTMFGGFVGGLVLGLGYMWRRGISIRHTIDAAAPGFVVGVMFGRIGDLVIADHLGTRTDFFLGYRIPEGADLAPGYGAPTYVAGAVVHQTALYDLIGLVVLAGALALFARREPNAGMLFAFFSVWYGLQRFVIDFTRNRDVIESFFFGLSGSQWAGLAFAAGGIIGFVWFKRRPAPALAAEPSTDTPEPSPPEAAPAGAGQPQAEEEGSETGVEQPGTIVVERVASGETETGSASEAPDTQGPTTEAPDTQGPTTETSDTQGPTTETPDTQRPPTQVPEAQAPERPASED